MGTVAGSAARMLNTRSHSAARTSEPLPQHVQAARVERAHGPGQVSEGGGVPQVQGGGGVVGQHPGEHGVLHACTGYVELRGVGGGAAPRTGVGQGRPWWLAP